MIVDELCSGTTAKDASAISSAVLDHLLRIKCLTVFATHCDALATEFADREGLENFTMSAVVDEKTKSVIFLYKMVPGVTSQSRGIDCARAAGVPASVCDMASTFL